MNDTIQQHWLTLTLYEHHFPQLESLPASSNEEHSTTNHNVEIQKQHIVVPSIVSHKNPSPQAPKTRKPYCQQTLTAYAEIDSLAGSVKTFFFKIISS